MKIMIWGLALAVLVLGCGPWLQSCWGLKDKEPNVAWDRIKQMGTLANLTYSSDADIHVEYGDKAWIKILEDQQVKIVMVTDDITKEHWLGIRGTANTHNALMDAQYLKEKDPQLNIQLHKGFHRLAKAGYDEFTPRLKPGYKIWITGHSLGGAGAAILAMYYFQENRVLEQCITFGQPKVTNEKGVKKFWDMPLLRIVDNKDIVPLVPPLTIVSALHGAYRHAGEEIILKPKGHWLWFSKHNANRMLLTGTWSNLFHESVEDHFMRNYLAKINKIIAR
mgnify:FL=1|jgi:hypothetical protein